MTEFEKIMEEMRRRGIAPRVRYELLAIRWLKRGAIVLAVTGIVWLIWK